MLVPRLRNLHILSKIVTISVVSIIFITLVILLYFMPLVEQKMFEGKREGVKNVVEVIFSNFQKYDDFIRAGDMTREAAQKDMIKLVKALRYRDNDYIWINDMTPKMIMHPYKPELDGQDLTEFKDPNGKHLFVEFVKVCKTHGSGFVDYLWPKPGELRPVEKISFVKLYEPWGWIIGSGLYFNDVRADIRRLRNYVLIGILIFTVLTISLAIYIGTGITRPLKKVAEGLQDIAGGRGRGALAKRIAINSTDEIGKLSMEFNSLMDSISDLSVFKKVIEEDENLEEVYKRLGEVFTKQLDISRSLIYQIVNARNTMHLTYPNNADLADMLCNQSILDDTDLCKAKRTGHTITSTIFPAICRQFAGGEGTVHYCLPIVVGGATVGVVQFVFDAPGNESDSKAMEAKVFKAEQYINESLAVIETKRLMSSLQDSALIDPLTGLHNRRYLQEYTEKIVAGVHRRGKVIGLIMCDLDYFKQVNDTYGHASGDIVLQQTAKAIQQSIRESDIVIRFGGEEFLVVLLDISEGESMLIAEKIRLNMEQLKIKIPEGVIQKTISLGTSEFPGDTGTLWSCIKYADVALYSAKAGGRNRCVRFTKDMWKEDKI